MLLIRWFVVSLFVLGVAACGGPPRAPDVGASPDGSIDPGATVDAGRAAADGGVTDAGNGTIPDAGPTCPSPGCDDSNPCTTDRCGPDGCDHLPAVGAACDDGDLATFLDTCGQTGTCAGRPVACPAATACVGWRPNGTEQCAPTYTMNACDDGSPSTFADTCDGAGTCAGRVVVCPQETACSLWLPNGTDTCTPLFTLDPCDDGLPETSGDACDGAGTCVGNPVVCPAALPCTGYAPDGTPTCRPVFLTTACDDGAVATSDDACDGAGACVGRPVTCPSDTACTLWTPNGTATCTPAFTTAACDDADAATFGDTCDGRGACAGTPVMCPESTACTRWATNGTATCTRVFTTDACDDGRLTTHTDTCDGQGNCAGTPVSCPAATACTRYEADGTPTCQAVFTTGSCDDGNACTQVDRCDAGRCVGSSPVVCRAPDRCETAVRCVPETGACVTSLETAGTACDDGLAATYADACDADGRCAGTPVTCPAGDACTGYAPNGTETCVATPRDGAACDDADPCTPRGTCLAGACVLEAPVSCARGTCSDGRCVCPTGWTGAACDVDVNECAAFPCGGGTCTNTQGGFTCACTANFRLAADGTCISAIPALEVAVLYTADVERRFGRDTVARLAEAFEFAKTEYDNGLSTPSMTLSLNAVVRLAPATLNFRRCNTPTPSRPQCTGCWFNFVPPDCSSPLSTVPTEFDIQQVLADLTTYARVTRAAAVRTVSRGADVVMLVTDDDPPASLAGLAYVGVACTNFAGALVSTRGVASGRNMGVVMAHELGHTLSMNHDPRGATTIMAPSASPEQTGFSASSLASYRQWVPQATACLGDTAEAGYLAPTCGNGRLDGDEECDPGIAADTCCTSACRLAAGCECANTQLCCAGGRLKAAGTVCRASADASCDPADTCDGVNATCQDLVAPAGTACTDVAGVASTCSAGACAASPTTQCRRVDLNPASATWTPCVPVTGCDRLLCTQPGGSTCGVSWSRVEDGTPCGTDSVCLGSACIASSTLDAPEWRVGVWGDCVDGIASREVFCRSSTGALVTDDRCWDVKPGATKSCVQALLSSFATLWSEDVPAEDDVLPVPHAPLIPGAVP